MRLRGVDKVIEALVYLGIGEVGGEDGHDVSCVGDGVRDCFVCVPFVPFVRAEGDQRRNGAVKSPKTGFAGGKGLMVESDFVMLIVQRW